MQFYDLEFSRDPLLMWEKLKTNKFLKSELSVNNCEIVVMELSGIFLQGSKECF